MSYVSPLWLVNGRVRTKADTSSFCKSGIRKLLIKDEHRRLGSNSGASEVKQHKWFNNISWGLLRHMTPPVSHHHSYPPTTLLPIMSLWLTYLQIIPAESNGIDAINFRTLRDSKSMDFERTSTDDPSSAALGDVIHALAGSPSVLSPGTPGMLTPRELVSDAGMCSAGLTPGLGSASGGAGSSGGGAGGLEAEVNPFGEFSSVTRDVGDW